MEAIIIGGGIGGLCTAIALKRAGISAAVYERADELTEIGAGLALAANGVKALDKLGLAEAVRRVGAPVMNTKIRSWRGQVLSEVPIAEVARRVNAESIVVHRADLQVALLRELGDAIRLGARCVGFEQDGTGVVARFADGREARGDILIGCDGLNSVIRARLFGERAPRYAGCTAWRGVTEFEPGLISPEVTFESWGRGALFGMAHIGSGRIYWFATKNAPEGEDDGPLGPKAALLEMFRGWHEPIRALIEATEDDAILRNDIYDREPLETWSNERVTLLGDAAHPMTPNLGQGACQAIEDAVVLADCFGEGDDPASILRAYEARRTDRANTIVKQSRRVGWVAQWENTVACRLRDLAVKSVPSSLQLKQLERVVGYTA